jgi:peroxiredoxin
VDLNIEIIGISRDLPPSQARFKETVKAQNTFLSDVDAKVISAYGALNPDNRIARRYYFLIDEKGALIWKNTTGQLIPVEKLLTDLSALLKAN